MICTSHTAATLLILAEWTNTLQEALADLNTLSRVGNYTEWDMSGTERGTIYGYINECVEFFIDLYSLYTTFPLGVFLHTLVFFFYVPAFVWLYHTVKPYYWNHWRSEVNNNDNLTAMQCAVQNPLIAKALPKPQGVDLTSKIPLIQIRSSICGMCWNKGDQWRPHLATHKIKRIWPCPLCARLHRTLPEILFP